MLNVTAFCASGGRANQEDTILVDRLGISGESPFNVNKKIDSNGLRIFAVADGMGGHHSGNIASKNLIIKLNEIFLENKQYSFDDINKSLIEKILLDYKSELEIKSTDIIGTTISIVFIYNKSNVKVYNVGDSPIMVFDPDNSSLTECYEEMTLYENKLRKANIFSKLLLSKNDKNVLTAAVGKKMDLKVYENHFKFEEGNKIIICSDGLTINRKKLKHYISMNSSAEDLYNLALLNGTSDNVSAIIIENVQSENRNGTLFSYDIASSVGKCKTINEDCFVINDIANGFDTIFSWSNYKVKSKFKWNIAAVADGVTGSVNGKIASKICMQEMRAAYKEGYFNQCDTAEQLEEQLYELLNNVSKIIADELTKKGQVGEAATTLSIAFFNEKEIQCFNLGDSPIYLERENVILPMSLEHNVDANNLLSSETPRKKETCNLLTEYVSNYRIGQMYNTGLPLGESDKIILVTDGIMDELNRNDLLEQIGSEYPAKGIVEKALDGTAQDNLTAIVIGRLC